MRCRHSCGHAPLFPFFEPAGAVQLHACAPGQAQTARGREEKGAPSFYMLQHFLHVLYIIDHAPCTTQTGFSEGDAMVLRPCMRRSCSLQRQEEARIRHPRGAGLSAKERSVRLDVCL